MRPTAVDLLCDFIMRNEGWIMGAPAFENRNPGNLRAGNHGYGVDAKEFTIFPNLEMGYAALRADCMAKITGHTHTQLSGNSTLTAFFEVRSPASDGNAPEALAQECAAYLTRGTGITWVASDPLQKFLVVK